MSEIIYTLPESTIDEILRMIEDIEYFAEKYRKKYRDNRIAHSCEVRAFISYIRNRAASTREYISDEIADQVQASITSEGEMYLRTDAIIGGYDKRGLRDKK